MRVSLLLAYMPRTVYALIKGMLIFEPEKRPDLWKVKRIVQDLQKAQLKTRVEGKVLERLKPSIV